MNVQIPRWVFTDRDLSYVTQSLGMWLCFLCSESRSGEIMVTINDLQGYVGNRLSIADIYRLQRKGLISYQDLGAGRVSIRLV